MYKPEVEWQSVLVKTLKLTLRTSVDFRNLSAGVTWRTLLFSGIQNINSHLTKLLVEDVDIRNQISEIHRIKGDIITSG